MNIRKIYKTTSLFIASTALSGTCLMSSAALAQGQGQESADGVTLSAEEMRKQLEELQEQLNRQRQQLGRQQQQLESQRQVIDAQTRRIQQILGQAGVQSPSERTEEAAPSSAQSRQSQAAAQEQPRTVGQREEAERATESTTSTEVSIFADVGGVLTPKGRFSLEPRVDYTHSDVNRFFFQGVEIVDVVLVGLFELTDADRDTVTSSLTARYGITDRLEIDAQVPYVVRDDRIVNEALNVDNATLTRELSGNGIGDAEVGLHYQINRPRGSWPTFVANFRAKSDLGEGPFEVSRDEDGLETELPVGSGFWTLEPSLTILKTLDPAVLFFNAGYLFNLAKDVNAQIGDNTVNRFNPGDTIRAGFGMGVGLNETLSFSLGYEHNYVFGSRTFIDEGSTKSGDFHVGSLLFGISAGLTDKIGLNLNTQVGVTEDAPDVRISLRLPFRF